MSVWSNLFGVRDDGGPVAVLEGVKRKKSSGVRPKYLCASFMTGSDLCVPVAEADMIFEEAARRGDEWGMPVATWSSSSDETGRKARR